MPYICAKNLIDVTRTKHRIASTHQHAMHTGGTETGMAHGVSGRMELQNTGEVVKIQPKSTSRTPAGTPAPEADPGRIGHPGAHGVVHDVVDKGHVSVRGQASHWTAGAGAASLELRDRVRW